MPEKVKSSSANTNPSLAPNRYRGKIAFCLLIFVPFCSVLARVQKSKDSAELFSPSIGQRFYEIAYEIANNEDANDAEVKQAIIFLMATTGLDSRAKDALPEMVKLTSRHSAWDYTRLVSQLLVQYLDESADLEVAKKAVGYLLDQTNSREAREQLLGWLLQSLGTKNPAMDSELGTLHGLLMAEKPDTNNAAIAIMDAYNNNKYNKLAFEKLTELMPEQINPAMRIEHLRLALRKNPLDIEAALAFAQYAEQLQLYDTAANAYAYCADLFGYFYPSEALPASIYLPWAISSYNTPRNQYRCLQIAESIRQSGRFDLFAEAIAAKTAEKIGNTELANQLFQNAEDKAQDNYQSQTANRKSQIASQLAWFYCFALPNAENALDWANKAYSNEPDSTTAALLAYALTLNDQTDWAKPLIENYQHNQIALLALAQIQRKQDQKNSAIETLKLAIAKDPGALEAEQAKQILAQLGGDYIPQTDPAIILTMLKNSFGQTIVPAFAGPDKIISVQLNVRGSKFSYGNPFGGFVAITNNSAEPLIISDDSLFTGSIRVDANVTGDLNEKIPNLVSTRVQPALPIEPERSLIIPLRLVTGKLRQLLLTHPQASLDIEFTAFIDPVNTSEGPINRLPDIKPVKVAVKRPGKLLNGKFLRNRINSLAKGQQGQKIATIQLFIGLLMEQNAMANRKPPYKFIYADWMPAMLKSAILHSLADDDWVAKTHTLASMLLMPMDYDLINASAESLNDAHWPVRMMALYLLQKKQDSSFAKVLNWAAKYDSHKLVRDMAIALGAVPPAQQELPPLPDANQPASEKIPQEESGVPASKKPTTEQ